MILWLVLLIGVILLAIGLYRNLRKDGYYDDGENFIACSIIVGVIGLILTASIATSRAGDRVFKKQMMQTQEMIVTIRSDSSMSVIERTNLTNKILDNNNDLISRRYYRNNVWTYLWYDPCVNTTPLLK